jgi:hypothetical protein
MSLKNWNETTVVKVGMGVDKSNYSSCWKVVCFLFAFWTCRPIWSWPFKPVDPIDDSLGFIPSVNDDRVARLPVCNH